MFGDDEEDVLQMPVDKPAGFTLKDPKWKTWYDKEMSFLKKQWTQGDDMFAKSRWRQMKKWPYQEGQNLTEETEEYKKEQ